ncbi:MAG: thioesterase domain-containing protein [Bryobacteraceae bacterium]
MSRQSREAALAYAHDLSVLPFESVLEGLLQQPKKAAPTPPRPALETLSGDKKKLLALRLRQKSSGTESSAWFSGLEDRVPGRTLLFCFPHAGGGAMVYHRWRETLGPKATVCPILMPGRETRIAEPAMDDMGRLVDALGHQIVSHLHKPYAFFGHSMGGTVAFEVARWLRARGFTLPSRLIVSAVRAPQFRLNHQPGLEPSNEALLAELRKLQGIPEEILSSEEAMKLVLPALKADTTLYRNYIYERGAAFGFPIHAFGGLQDPNIERIHLEGWREQTTASFRLLELTGGHFYYQNSTGVSGGSGKSLD